MRKLLASSSVRFALASVLLVGAYGAYLALGGTLGRELIKANLIILRADYSVRLDSDGSGCSSIGEWLPDEHSCFMTRDLQSGERLRIAGDGITLDGNGHEMRAPDGGGPAILMANVADVEIRNLRITGYEDGIRLQRASTSLLHDLKIDSVSGHAINMMGDSRYNRILNNDLGPADWHGVAMVLSHGNVIAGNYIVGTRDAVRLQSSQGNVVTYNRTVGSMIEGIDVHISDANTVFLNDLMETVAQPILDDTEEPGANTYETRWGGNYVLAFDEEIEGCTDRDGDLRCDGRFEFFQDTGEAFLTSAVTGKSEDFFDSDATWASTIDRIAALGTPEVVCSGCHDLEQGVEAEIGPPLHGVVGRAIATYPDFAYSPALGGLEGVWTEELLRELMRDPASFAPGTTMAFPGIDDPAVVEGILQFLRRLE